MRKILTLFSFGLFCLASLNLLAQSPIVIDVSKTIENQNPKPKGNFTKNELGGLTLQLNNLHDKDKPTDYQLDGNFTDPSDALNLANQNLIISNKTLTFNIESLKGVVVNDGKNIKLIVKYTGNNKPAIFGDNNSFFLPINITESGIVNPPNDCKTITSVAIQEKAVDYVTSLTGYNKYHSKKTNLFIQDNIVHIYVDENGNLIKTGIPTTAKESYLYQVHLLYEENNCERAEYEFSYDGAYTPKFNILKTGDRSGNLNSSNGTVEKPEAVIKELEYAVIGPFTDEFEIKLVKKVKDKEPKVLLNHKIKVATLYHVSISTGLLYSSLRNPQNIETFTKANGETTLVADDPRDRGILSIMATFYPWGRSFLFPPEGGILDKSRFGIQVGTRLDDKLAENFFLGLSHDFARGGTFSYGVHYGRRNYVAGARDFDFGNDVFDLPELKVKQEWGVGFYVGVVIDTRVAVELIKSIGGNN